MSGDQDYKEQIRREVERELLDFLNHYEAMARKRQYDDMATAIAATKVAVALGTYRKTIEEKS